MLISFEVEVFFNNCKYVYCLFFISGIKMGAGYSDMFHSVGKYTALNLVCYCEKEL